MTPGPSSPPPSQPAVPDLSIPSLFPTHPRVQAALDGSPEVVDGVNTFLDTATSTLTSLQSSDTFSSFLQRAGAAAGIVGDIGSGAPLVGVVFAALAAVGKHISAVEDTRTGFNQLYATATTTAQLLQSAESSSSGITVSDSTGSRPSYPAAVSTALSSFWAVMYELAQLLYEVRGAGYVRRLLGDGGYSAQLKSIGERLQQAKSDLQLATGLAMVPVVDRIAVEVHALLSRVDPTAPLPSSFKLPSQYLYVHRQALWQRLSELWTTTPLPLQATDSPSSPKAPCPPPAQPYIVVLSGLGGIGKSQLALRYALATAPTIQSPSASPPSLPTYSLRAWFDASSADQLQAAFLAFATTCLHLPGIDRTTPPDSVRAAVKAWLEGQPSWLLVFDNVEVYDDVAQYLPSAPSASSEAASPPSSSSPISLAASASSSPAPPSSSSYASLRHHHVLITSRCRTWPPPPLVQEVQVDEQLTDAESVELLVRLMHKRKQPPVLSDCLQDAAYLSLVAQLQHYPLAISQAGAFLSQRQDVQLSAYAAQCESNLLRQKVLPTGDIRKDRNRDTVAFTFLASIDAVEHDAQQQDMQPVGRALLTACAYLQADDIPVALLDMWLSVEYAAAVATTPDLLQATLPLLESYSLLHVSVERQTVSVHRVLQAAVRHLHGVEQPVDDSTAVDGQLRLTLPGLQPPPTVVGHLSLSWYLRLMAAATAAYYKAEGERNQRYIIHLDQLQRGYYQHLAPLLGKVGKPCPDEVVYALLALGEGRMQWPTQPTSSAAGAAELGAASSTTAKAALLQCLAEYEQLPRLHTQPRFHQLFYCLARVSSEEGRHDDSLGFIQRAHQLRDALPADSISVADHARCLHLQLLMLFRLGRHSQELVVCEQLLELSQQQLDHDEYVPQDIGVPWCMYKLAMACGSAGRHDKCRELLRSALGLYKEYCSRHADAPVPEGVRWRMVRTRIPLGEQSADDNDLASLQQQLLSCQQRYGEVSPLSAVLWRTIGSCHWQAGSYQPAVDAFSQVVRIYTTLYGPQHSQLIEAYQTLGMVHEHWTQLQLALAAYQRALDISRQQAVVDTQVMATLQQRVASCSHEQGEGQEATGTDGEVLAVNNVATPKGHKLS